MADRVSLDRLITIQQVTETRSSYGHPTESWSDLEADVPAQYLPVSGAEQFQARQHLATAVARFRVRWRTDLTRKMRIIFDSENWNIQHFEEDRRYGRQQYLLITALLIGAT